MSLYRVVHDKENPYLTVNTTIATDTRLSWKAKGIWFYAFSRKDDWQFYEADLVKRSSDSVASLRSGLKELEDKGYLFRPDQRKNKKGKFIKREWYFFETPKSQEEIKIILPQCGFPTTGKSSAEKSSAENRTLLNNEEPSIDLTSKEEDSSPNSPSASSALSEDAFGLVDFLHSKIQEMNPKAKPPDRHKWATTIDRMNRLDGYGWDEIRALIEFAHNDPFWSANILSADKLRKQATQLTAKMKQSSRKSPAEQSLERSETNRKLADDIRLRIKEPYRRLRVFDTGCEVKVGAKWVSLRYSENGFKEQLESLIRKGENR